MRQQTQSPEREGAIAEVFLELAKRSKVGSQRVTLYKRAADGFEFADRPGAGFGALTRAIRIAGPMIPLLARAEPLAVAAGTIGKLNEIYDHFIEHGSTELRRVLVLRQARLLSEEGDMASEALDRVLVVSATDPVNVELLDCLERLAEETDRVREVVSAYKQRAEMVGVGARAVTLSLRSAQLCKEHDRFNDSVQFLGLAIKLSESDAERLDEIEEMAKGLGRRTLKRMVGLYEDASTDCVEEDPGAAATFLMRAARLMRSELNAPGASFDVLKKALSLNPAEHILAELETAAVELELVEQLEVHLDKVAAATMENDVAAAVLWRRAQLLEAHLERREEAAEVMYRVWAMRPDDPNVHRRLRALLIQAGKLNEVIGINEREIGHRADLGEKLALMRDTAQLWENEIGNKWEAIDAWKRVLEHNPTDADAAEAIKRLSAKPSVAPDELTDQES